MSKVPVGWQITSFENHIELLSGFAFKSEQYTSDEEDIRLLRGDNIEPGSLRWRNAKRWPLKEFSQLERYQLREGDFVIAMDRTWVSSGLKVAEVGAYDLPCLLVQRVSRIRAKKTLGQSLLRQYFSGKKFEDYVKSVQTETAVPHISSQQIKEFSLLLPPLPEQTKIAKILSTWDKAIATTEQLIGNSQQQKKALMQSLLTGKKRLPGFEGELINSTLENACYINPKKASRPEDGLVSFISMESVSEDAKLIRAEVRNYDDVEKGFTSFSDNDVLVAKITPCFENGKGAYLDELKNGVGFGSTEFHVLRAKKNTYSKFVYYVTNTDEFRVRGEANMQGSAGQKRVTTDYLKQFPLKLPPLPEQQKIAQILTAADNEIELLQKKLAFLKQEKTALMQQLLTGKRRVKINATEECMDA